MVFPKRDVLNWPINTVHKTIKRDLEEHGIGQAYDAAWHWTDTHTAGLVRDDDEAGLKFGPGMMASCGVYLARQGPVPEEYAADARNYKEISAEVRAHQLRRNYGDDMNKDRQCKANCALLVKFLKGTDTPVDEAGREGAIVIRSQASTIKYFPYANIIACYLVGDDAIAAAPHT